MRPIDETSGRGGGDDYEATILLARLRAGEAAAFERLFDLCASAVYAYLRIVLDDPADADDATEDVFAEALESLSEPDYRSLPVRVWLLRIAHEYASELNAIAPAAGEHEPKQLAVTATLLLTEKSGWVGDDALVSVVSGLPAGPREALVLRQIIGFSTSEAAKVLGRTPDQVAMLERSAIDSLCDLLRPFNGRPPLPPERLGVQRRVRESPVACQRRRALAVH
jgi:RNA polymerase sigma-70 factor (ECF subfamily)